MNKTTKFTLIVSIALALCSCHGAKPCYDEETNALLGCVNYGNSCEGTLDQECDSTNANKLIKCHGKTSSGDIILRCPATT